MLEATRPYTEPLDDETLRRVLLVALVENTADILGTCTDIALTIFDRKENAPYEFNEKVYDEVVRVKERIQEDLDKKLSAYRAQVKVMAQANLRLLAAEGAKVDEARETFEREYAALGELKESMLDAQRAEHYIRVIPAVYKSQDAHQAIWAIGLYLRNNMWNPRASKNSHAAVNEFIYRLFR